MLKFPIYLDNNATTPMDRQVLETMLPYFTERFGNAASRTHAFGWVAEEAVQVAREQVASLIGAEAEEIVFTSGATEAVNLAIKGACEIREGNKHIITCATEHKAVLDTCKHLEKKGVAVTYLPVDASGQIDLNQLEEVITPQTILISIMFANNETGVLQPINDIAAIAKKHGIWFFSDATQAVGKVPMNVAEQGIDLLALSAHKFYGPKGVGALYMRRKTPRVRVTAQMDGGGHEKGFRSGTLNVPGIVGLGKAAELSQSRMPEDTIILQTFRNQLETSLLATDSVSINGSINNRLPNTSNLCFHDVDGGKLLIEINKSIAVSSGSACTSANPTPSHVLKAMDISDELIKSSIRFGLSRFTTQEETDYCISEVKRILEHLQVVK